VERGVTEVDDVVLSALIKMNAPTAVGSSALLGIKCHLDLLDNKTAPDNRRNAIARQQ
jgi:hypothetical protein